MNVGICDERAQIQMISADECSEAQGGDSVSRTSGHFD